MSLCVAIKEGNGPGHGAAAVGARHSPDLELHADQVFGRRAAAAAKVDRVNPFNNIIGHTPAVLSALAGWTAGAVHPLAAVALLPLRGVAAPAVPVIIHRHCCVRACE